MPLQTKLVAFALASTVLAAGCGGSGSFAGKDGRLRAATTSDQTVSMPESQAPGWMEPEGSSPTGPVSPEADSMQNDLPSPALGTESATESMISPVPVAPTVIAMPGAAPLTSGPLKNCHEALGANPTRITVTGNNESKAIAAANGLLLVIDANNPNVSLVVEAPPNQPEIAGICLITEGNSTLVQLTIRNAVLKTFSWEASGNVNAANVVVDAGAEVKRTATFLSKGNNNVLTLRGSGKLGCNSVQKSPGLTINCGP